MDDEKLQMLAHQVSILTAAVHAMLKTGATTETSAQVELALSHYLSTVQCSHASDEIVSFVEDLCRSLLDASRPAHS